MKWKVQKYCSSPSQKRNNNYDILFSTPLKSRLLLGWAEELLCVYALYPYSNGNGIQVHKRRQLAIHQVRYGYIHRDGRRILVQRLRYVH